MKMSLMVFCGPPGSGKSILMKKLTTDFQANFAFSVSHTSRVGFQRSIVITNFLSTLGRVVGKLCEPKLINFYSKKISLQLLSQKIRHNYSE